MTARRLKTTHRERTLIQSDLIAHLKRGPRRLDELTCVGTPEQTLCELRTLEAHRLVRLEPVRRVWVYLGLDQRIPQHPVSSPAIEGQLGTGRVLEPVAHPQPASISGPSSLPCPVPEPTRPSLPAAIIPMLNDPTLLFADLRRPPQTSEDLPKTSMRHTKT